MGIDGYRTTHHPFLYSIYTTYIPNYTMLYTSVHINPYISVRIDTVTYISIPFVCMYPYTSVRICTYMYISIPSNCMYRYTSVRICTYIYISIPSNCMYRYTSVRKYPDIVPAHIHKLKAQKQDFNHNSDNHLPPSLQPPPPPIPPPGHSAAACGVQSTMYFAAIAFLAADPGRPPPGAEM
jgi:hypothetical protein